ncbi:MAG: DUF1232 domain-containing protein [Gammaproteobacteria bacterium]|nr:DUF1232 domain-containing protein [Gammaproteobacteria bacterium]
MVKQKKLAWLLQSRAYRKARSLVDATVGNPERLLALVANAQTKTTRDLSGRLSAVLDSTAAAFRLLKAYARGEYRQISFESLALIVASIIYFVMPLDVFPDFIVALGLTDDAALLAWTFRTVAGDIEKFLAWEAAGEHPAPTEDP